MLSRLFWAFGTVFFVGLCFVPVQQRLQRRHDNASTDDKAPALFV